MDDLIEIEEQGWRALSSPGSAAAEYYGSLLADDAAMLFPGGVLLEGKAKILESFGPQPWQSFQLEEPRVLSASETVGVIIYKVTAEREGSNPYSALVSSTYAVSGGKWKSVLHQQTPV